MKGIHHLPDTWVDEEQKGSLCGLVFNEPGWTPEARVILYPVDRDTVDCPNCLTAGEPAGVSA